MEELERRLSDYLESITGTRPDLQKSPAERTRKLPLFLRERYEFRSVRILGRKCVLALENQGWEPGSPSEYASHAQALTENFGEISVIVIPGIASYARNRMVQAGVPFIVPKRHLFLPPTLLDLRERFGAPRASHSRRLTPATQCILLYHLQREPLEGVPLRTIAKKVGYSAMKLTRAKDELEGAELCGTARLGHSVVMEFAQRGHALWERALPLLSSPVRKSHWVNWRKASYPAIPAGLTALSRQTMLEDDRIPTYALMHTTYRMNLEQGLFHGSPGPSEANAQLEAWSYSPLLLGNEQGVDSLSLVLSLRHLADERVQQQLATLIDQIHWA